MRRDSSEADDGFKVFQLRKYKNNYHQDNVLTRPDGRQKPSPEKHGMKKVARSNEDAAGIVQRAQCYKGLEAFKENFPSTPSHRCPRRPHHL